MSSDISGLLLGETSFRNLAEAESEDDEDYAAPAEPTKSKKRSRASKTSAKDSEEPKQKKRAVKSAEFVEDSDNDVGMNTTSDGDTDRTSLSSRRSSTASTTSGGYQIFRCSAFD
jgi:hypothetical protein